MIKSSHHVFVFHDNKKVCKFISRFNYTEFPEFFGEGGCARAKFTFMYVVISEREL
jgi:hypothetical protein